MSSMRCDEIQTDIINMEQLVDETVQEREKKKKRQTNSTLYLNSGVTELDAK